MEEKERYEFIDFEDRIELIDTENKKALDDADKIKDTLNQQDKRIKELEQESYPAYKREHKRRAYLENIEVPRLEKENQQLKQQLETFAYRISDQNEEILELKQQLEDYKDICHKHYIDCTANLDRVLLGTEQQLHDLPKKE